jgi:hypothetical protein
MSDYFDRVERQIVRRVEEGGAGTWRSHLTPGNLAVVAAVLVVVVVAGVFLAARGGRETAPSPASHPALTVAFTAASDDTRAIDESVRVFRERLHAVFPGAQVVRSGDGVTVTLTHATPGARNRILALAAPGRLAFYDWEADVLAPNGKPVASQLQTGDPTALAISQGAGSAAPGDPGAGGVPMQRALLLVRKAARGRYIIVQALDTDPRHPIPPGAPNAKFYVLRDQPALSGAGLTNPRASTDPNLRAPDVEFGFTAAGGRVFQAMTKEVARRGSLVSGLGQTLNQHFAIVLDNRVISVPFIDYRQYPDGINGDQGADLAGNFTTQSARDLAILLRYGPLPVHLTAAG